MKNRYTQAYDYLRINYLGAGVSRSNCARMVEVLADKLDITKEDIVQVLADEYEKQGRQV